MQGPDQRIGRRRSPERPREIARKTKRGLLFTAGTARSASATRTARTPGAEGLTVSEARTPEEDTIEPRDEDERRSQDDEYTGPTPR